MTCRQARTHLKEHCATPCNTSVADRQLYFSVFFFLMHNVLPARPQQWWNIPYYNLPTLRRRPRDDLRPSFGLHLLGPVAGKAVKKKWRPQARRKSGAMQLAMAAAAAKDAGVNKK